MRYELKCREQVLELGRGPAVIMGILNVTPDSFSDGGDYLETSKAVRHAMEMVDEGAGIIDVGGESTRPGAESVPPAEQIRRVAPVIWALKRQVDVPISIDTTDSEVAEAALAEGASIINDVSALRFDERMAELAASSGAAVVLMHMLADPATMQENPTYVDVVKEVMEFLAERLAYAQAAGIERCRLVVDPGIGFGKTAEHNLRLIKQAALLHELGMPVLVGPSRKRFIGSTLGISAAKDRLLGTAAAVACCVAAAVQIVRVHDVKEMAEVAALTAAIREA